MSFSFSFTADNKVDAKRMATAYLADVVAVQKVHQRDAKQAEAVAHAYIDLVDEPRADQGIAFNMSGSIAGDWQGDGSDVTRVTGANVSLTAALTTLG